MPTTPDAYDHGMESWSTLAELDAARDRFAAALDGYQAPAAYGLGVATLGPSGQVLDTWFPHVNRGTGPLPAVVLAGTTGYRSTTSSFRVSADDLDAAIATLTPADATTEIPHPNLWTWRSIRAALDGPLSGGRTRVAVAVYIADLDDAPVDIHDAYLRLHLLSHRAVQPHGTNLDGLFGLLANVVWTNEGPFEIEGFALAQLAAAADGRRLTVYGIDRFPRMVDYVIPVGVRIADANRVRLGAHLADGTVVMHEGFCNFNAGTLGPAMVEGRISAGVVVHPNSDVGGGASIQGTLSGGGKETISIGEGCLLGANGGIGISLGNNCTVEAGLYVTAGSLVLTADGTVVKARTLSGQDNLLFRRNSTTGAIEVITKQVEWGGLNADLH